MNKLTKVLSVFLLAGALGASVAGVTACKGGNGGDGGTTPPPSGVTHQNSHQLEYTPKDDTQHTVSCPVDGCDFTTHDEGHTWGANDTECPDCHTAKPVAGEKFTIPAAVDGIIIEGITQETVTLSPTKTSHTIDTSAIKVYLATDNVKGDEVPAANVIISVKKPGGTVITELSGLKEDGAYNVDVSLDATKCEMAQGAAATVGDLKDTVTVTISNPVQQGSLVVKQGDGVLTTQMQTAVNSILPTWTYEVTLANGDKKDVPASEVTVSGLDTTKINDSGVATLTWGTITGTQAYTITANENLVAQSFAVNFGELTEEQKTKLKTEDVSIQGGRFVVQATGGEVADHRGSAPDYDGKYLASRLKLGGKYDADNAKRYVKITTDGEATITVYGYANSGTAGAGAAGRFLSIYKNVTYGPKGGTDESKQVGTGSDLVGTKQDTLQKENSKHEFTVTEAGTYWLVCETGDVCITYIQVDQLVTKADGVEAITLAGETKLAKLSVKSTTTDYKQTFTVGDTFSVSEEYSYEGVYYNTVTMEKVKTEAVTTGITYWLGETQLTPGTTVLEGDLFEKLGEQKITVKVDGETEAADYTVVVESAVPGVTGITASVNKESTEVADASAKLTLNKTDIAAAIVGENENATVNVTSVKYRLKSAEAGTETEIESSVELAPGEYVLVVTANVADATASKNADFTATCNLIVSVAGARQDVSMLATEVATKVNTDGYAEETVLYTTADGTISVTGNSSKKTVIETDGTNGRTYGSGDDAITFSHRIKFGGAAATNQCSLVIETKGAATITVYCISSSSGAARAPKVMDAEGKDITATSSVKVEGEAMNGTQILGTQICKVEFTVSEAGTYYFGSASSGLNVYGVVIDY